MSKIKLLLDVVSDIRSLADSLESVANAMCDNNPLSAEVGTDNSEPNTISETNNEKLPTLEDVRGVLAEKSAAGHGAEIRELLKKYGQTKLSAIDPQYYPALLADAEVL